jgi:ankyrin repeat protein
VPVRPLPASPSLENLKNQARTLQRRVRAGDPAALALVGEFDPRSADSSSPSSGFSLTSAQLLIARSHGFASWQRLRDHLDVIDEFARWPDRAPEVSGDAEEAPLALRDHFLNLACRFYSGDGPRRRDHARELLAAHPGVATVDIHTMAVVGEVEAVRRLLAEDPSQARRSGGPFDWEPLYYLTYARLGENGPGRSALATARLLLDAGADPNVGYLWQGLPSPFTALTGVFGGGEVYEPPHPQASALARLLLEAGADPNDNQTLYNRMFTPENDHLGLLFEFGLGTDVDSPWRRRMGHTYPSPAEMVQHQLQRAADHNLVERVRLLLDHRVDPDGRGYHPHFGGRTPYQLAVAAGNRDIARMLVEAGATPTAVDRVQAFLSACLAGDHADVERLRSADPALVAEAAAREPDVVVRAVRTGRLEAVRLLLDLGFDVNAGGETPLHLAALDGNLAAVRLLVERGADLGRRDPHHDATPLGWAQYAADQEGHGDTDRAVLLEQTVAFLAGLDHD